MREVSEVPLARLPYVEGVLSAVDIAETAASIASMQEPCGAIPWTVGEHVDIWNHVEGAMAMLVGGQVAAAERAYAWIPTMQRPDGSFPMKIVDGEPEDHRGEVNMSAYFAVGLWHHWLVRNDIRFVERYWPSVRAALDWVVSMQEPFGGIRWTPVDDFCLLTGNSSIYHSLRAGVALADLMDDPQPEWELAGGRLGHAIRVHRDLFADKSTFSMDWYYPVLGGAVRGRDAFELLESRWDDFVVPDLGIRCVDTNPWVTGAETCELAMALDTLGDHRRAKRLFADMQHLRGEEGKYWTGWVYGETAAEVEVVNAAGEVEPRNVPWPDEHTTYTAAAVILAADALGEVAGHSTPGSGIMRGTSLAPHFQEIALECDCPSPERVAGHA
ncbi:prenyltransferase/squalene oxidase repeat-containing protein [Nocardioides bizhenqiangii]|uniref:Prenyltransferase n=1 Tax=Nocardioides bizhenqiangii TaxID=3095076 RepID=A0ABZ0ZM68_9ACTN|nr:MULTISPECIES: prenyltransferase [unclassified Nocardioides]MDZ5620461.1 prenyltransferase [Nocardioides sp. HM23]WQQ24829.1 prenyltransferase [Nocardioides sp. HM61]